MATPTKTGVAKNTGEDWLRLSKLIFTRWVNQKLAKINVHVDDAITAFGTGIALVQLLEVLSEKKYEGKMEKNIKNIAQKIDNANNALRFLFDTCKVEMKIKPSAEDLVNGNEKNVLGLLWAIMSKYMKFGDDEEGGQLSARDALLLWVQNKLSTYDNVKIENFTTSFHDGLALCALIHKHRPKLIDYASLTKENKQHNLRVAIDAAEAYFGLEKYLTPEDIPKLDEKSMVVYISEYYYGIAEQRKLDLAAARIGKVVKLTIENDALRAEYAAKAHELVNHIAKVEKILEDRTIDNTMAGAKRKIEEFYEYKTKDKGIIIGMQLDLEGLYNTLAMKLSHNKRPEFAPPKGQTLKDIEQTIQHLEAVEQERKVALHAELNRQIKLVHQDAQHKSRFEKLQSWIAEKTAYLQTKEHITSVSQAQLQLRLLDAYDKESTAVHDGSFHQLKALGGTIVAEKYERSHDIQSREAEIQSGFQKLNELSKAKRPVLDDDLAREIFKEKVLLLNQQHVANHAKLEGWIHEKEAYLKKKEAINSVSEANTQISLLDAYDDEQKTTNDSAVKALKALGANILAQKYDTQYSKWSFENPNEIHNREKHVDDKFKELHGLSADKRKVLEADLHREQEKERLRLEYAHLASEFSRWTKETAEDVSDAQFGFTLEEVEAYQSVLSKSEADVKHAGQQKTSEYQNVSQQLSHLGVTENMYTKLSNDDLAKAYSALEHALENRNKAYQTELARQRANDQLCKDFAHLVDPFSKWISDQKDAITKSTASLEDQLANVKHRESQLATDGAKLHDIDALNKKLDEAGITNNRHTTLTAKDVHVQFEQYKAFLVRKQKMLEEEIEQHKLRGVTPEQLKEIEDNFAKFDADKSGKIDKKELKTCLYSLGEEKTNAEVQAILKQYGNGEAIPLDGFKQFMIGILAVTDSKEDILNAFNVINKGDSVGRVAKMEIVMSEHDLSYIKKTAPQADGGINYHAWTEDVFSR